MLNDFYLDISDRSIRDIDILIDKKDIRLVIDLLKEHKYSFKGNSFIYGHNVYDIKPIYDSSNVVIEIHHQATLNQKCQLTKQLLKNKENILAEDLFLHLIYHASAKQGFDVGVQIFADLIAILKSEK